MVGISYKRMKKNKLINRLIKGVFILIIPFAVFYTLYIDRVYPGVKVAGIDIGGKTTNEALQILSENVKVPEEITIAQSDETPPDQLIKIPSSSIDLKFNLKESIDKAYQLGRSGNILFDIDEIITSLNKAINLGLELSLNEDVLQKDISSIASKFTTDPTNPSVKIGESGEILIERGKPGTDIDRGKLRVDIGLRFAYLDNSKVIVTLIPIDPTLSESEAVSLLDHAQKLLGKKITINFEEKQIIIDENDLISFLSPKGGYDEEAISQKVIDIANEIERDPQNASFEFSSGIVKEFAPGKDGIKLIPDQTRQKLVDSINALATSDQKEVTITPSVTRTEPKVKTSDVNNLGIKELVGLGTSHFAGSITSRIHNISLAASKLNGVLIEPGQVFSFNDALGDISVYTGYQQAYIIKDGKTVMGDGGGVCQVSTTIFRAALNAGLPIIERNAHAYRVHYYEEDMGPGYDATVYSPTTDFKFKNDTPNYILIQTHTDTANKVLTFELYGTSDGRKSEISKSVITEVTPPPPDLYTDDPTLSNGTIKQIDFKAWGAKVYFNYKVERDGETII